VKLRLATLNVGLLRLFGSLVQPAPYVEERLAALPRALRALGAQIIALQEVYREPHRQFLIECLQDVFPYSAYSRDKPWWGLENGLMIFSTMPLEYRFERFEASPLDEKLVDCKGILISRFRDEKGGSWSLLNIHTTAGGIWRHPESPPADFIRARQIEQILRAAQAEPWLSIIAGDLNAGPGVSEGNFQQLEDAGYQSIHDLLNGRESGATWDPGNPLNANGPHRLCPLQRIDHLFVRREDLASGRVLAISSAICCRDATVPTLAGMVTVSDHYGLAFEIELVPSGAVS
jgi:endonuclease/exonuclease/phosphatase family metal-dependent hydrolase